MNNSKRNNAENPQEIFWKTVTAADPSPTSGIESRLERTGWEGWDNNQQSHSERTHDALAPSGEPCPSQNLGSPVKGGQAGRTVPSPLVGYPRLREQGGDLPADVQARDTNPSLPRPGCLLFHKNGRYGHRTQQFHSSASTQKK